MNSYRNSSKGMRKLGLAALAAAISLATAGSVVADDALPEARTLIDRHIELIGGLDALERQTRGTMEGTLSMPAANINGTLTMHIASPSERVMVVDLPGLGKMRSGVKDDLVWSEDPYTGPRILEGEERSIQLETMNPAAAARGESFVSELETVELAEIGGESCYRVRIEWKSGRESFDCYSDDSGLLVGMEMVMRSPMGEMPMTISLGEYKTLGGTMMATLSKQSVMGNEQVMTIESFDPAAPDADLLTLPPAIKALSEQAEAEVETE